MFLSKWTIALIFVLIPAILIIPPENINYDLAPFKSNLERYQQSGKKGYTAIVIGGTGAVGRELVKELLISVHTSKVTVITRKKLSQSHPKLHNIVIPNFDSILRDDQDIFEGQTFNAAFSTLGTTIKAAGSEEAFIRVDLDYNIAFARHLLRGGCKHFTLLTSIGSNPESWFFYPRIKGLVENAIQAFSFNSISIFRPSVLLTEREESRPAERVAQIVFPLFRGVLRGWFAKYAAIEVTDVARAMRLDYEIRVYSNEEKKPIEPRVKIYESHEIQQLANIDLL
jgi:uncharacterized protein YbjT (DUF2867 family)